MQVYTGTYTIHYLLRQGPQTSTQNPGKRNGLVSLECSQIRDDRKAPRGQAGHLAAPRWRLGGLRSATLGVSVPSDKLPMRQSREQFGGSSSRASGLNGGLVGRAWRRARLSTSDSAGCSKTPQLHSNSSLPPRQLRQARSLSVFYSL